MQTRMIMINHYTLDYHMTLYLNKFYRWLDGHGPEWLFKTQTLVLNPIFNTEAYAKTLTLTRNYTYRSVNISRDRESRQFFANMSPEEHFNPMSCGVSRNQYLKYIHPSWF